MTPSDASVYADQTSAGTWVLILTGVIIFVSVLMGLFIILVNRACEATGPATRPGTADQQIPQQRESETAPGLEPGSEGRARSAARPAKKPDLISTAHH